MKLFTFLLLCFLYGCDNCQHRVKILTKFKKIEFINSFLQQNNKQLSWINSSEELIVKFPQIRTLLIELKSDLNLTEVERHYLIGDSNRLGLAYKFTKDNKCSQYLLFTTSPADKEKFINFEQFVDYIKETTEINPYWTYRKVDVSAYE